MQKRSRLAYDWSAYVPIATAADVGAVVDAVVVKLKLATPPPVQEDLPPAEVFTRAPADS